MKGMNPLVPVTIVVGGVMTAVALPADIFGTLMLLVGAGAVAVTTAIVGKR